jgi:cell division septation protein DedD
MADEGFHEIQLSGKQLVFLFMATTLVSVVIFLFGVLVGRGVGEEGSAEVSVFAEQNLPAGSSGFVAVPPGGDDSPFPAEDEGQEADDLSYHRRLQGVETPAESLRVPEEAPAPVETPDPPRARPEPKVVSPPPAAAEVDRPTQRPGTGFTVQVVALRARTEAEAIAKRLSGKGYPAYVLEPTAGAPAAVYRVRVGHYENRREAEQIVRRLEREEQFKPWITR